ncbi:MAG: inorganic diphosphatase [Patescibacteria group bacterium]|nr:inorganic diphosphatase [Patescibacteria group bacterium]
MNPLHTIDPGTPDKINVIVEIPRGSANKYEIDKKSGLIKLDRVLHSAQTMPFDYGFIPQTLWSDGDPLDVVILATYPFMPGILVEVRPVAIMGMNDSGDDDAKIIAVPVSDPRWNNVNDLKDINQHTLKEIEHFYSTYKQLQNKKVVTHGFKGAADAREAFDIGIKNYKNTKK